MVSHAAVVSDNDGSAFITKAEFDSLKNNFQAQIDNYNQSIDSKIDGAIAAYLAGIKIDSGEYKLTVDWARSFPETPLGLGHVKYVDIVATTPFQYGMNKGRVYLMGNYNDSTGIYEVVSCRILTSGSGGYLPGSATSWQSNYNNTSDQGQDHPIYVLTVAGVNYNFCGIFLPGGQVNPGLGWCNNTVTGLSGLYSFSDQYGNPCRTYWYGAFSETLKSALVIDKYWSDTCGLNIVIKSAGEGWDISPKPWPLVFATDGEGDINFTYTAGDNHPNVASLDQNGIGSNKQFFSPDSKAFFAVTNLSTGGIVQYVTNQNGNIFRDSYTSGEMVSVDAHMRAGEALMLFIGTKYSGTHTGESGSAGRLKMNFRNLNP